MVRDHHLHERGVGGVGPGLHHRRVRRESRPKEIAWFDRGPLPDERLVLGGSWSAYWYNGYISSNDIQQGLDVLEVNDPLVDPAKSYRYDVLNVQSHPPSTAELDGPAPREQPCQTLGRGVRRVRAADNANWP